MTYYQHGKRGTLDGVPVWRPKWWGELGNDAEFIEATRPRTSFKQSYYEGGHRIVKDGIPCRVAAIVATWAPWMKAAILKGTAKTPREKAELKKQAKILGIGGKL